jgi:predicted ATP-dependent endonuclease of OLD family
MELYEFRGIKSCNKPLTLSDFTVLIGRNNSGKSSVLEAFSLLPLPTHNPDFYLNSRINLLKDLHA